MATALKDDAPTSVEYRKPDAAKAFDIYDHQIKPKLTRIDTARGECSQPWQDIKEHANFPRSVMNFIIALENIDDDAKRDHYLMALSEGLQHRRLFLPRDLVTMADGEDGGAIVQSEDRPKPRLVGIDDESDELTGDGTGEALPPADDDEFEASEEELAGQKPRSEEAEKKSLKRPSFQMGEAPLDAA